MAFLVHDMLNLDNLEIDKYKRKQLEEFLAYTMSQKRPLSFADIQKNIGISRRQWEIFRSNNSDKELLWKNE